MASMDVDKPLDELITADKKAKRSQRAPRPARGGKAPAAPAAAAGGARARYAQGAVPATNARQAAAAANVQGGAVSRGEAFKIIVSNLPLDVDDAAVKDLFDSTIGRTRECSLTYDRNGKHKGVATVVFHARGDAQKAFKTYNNRLVDGRTPMKVELVYTKPPVATPSLAARVAPAPKAPAGPAAAAAAGPRGGAKPRRGRGGAGGAKSEGRRAPKSAADLDAEMDSWKSTDAAPAAADAAPATTA